MTEEQLNIASKNRGIIRGIDNALLSLVESNKIDLTYGYEKEHIKEVLINALKAEREKLDFDFEKL